jgi:nucleolar protein 4
MKYYSSINGTKIIIDPINKNSKGYGFVKFNDQNEAQRAISEMNGKLLNGKPIKIK